MTKADQTIARYLEGSTDAVGKSLRVAAMGVLVETLYFAVTAAVATFVALDRTVPGRGTAVGAAAAAFVVLAGAAAGWARAARFLRGVPVGPEQFRPQLVAYLDAATGRATYGLMLSERRDDLGPAAQAEHLKKWRELYGRGFPPVPAPRCEVAPAGPSFVRLGLGLGLAASASLGAVVGGYGVEIDPDKAVAQLDPESVTLPALLFVLAATWFAATALSVLATGLAQVKVDLGDELPDDVFGPTPDAAAPATPPHPPADRPKPGRPAPGLMTADW